MSIRLFGLGGVPDDEADEIRELLDSNNIEYYETPDGNWGFSMAAIWLEDENQLSVARDLIKAYQTERVLTARIEYAKKGTVHIRP